MHVHADLKVATLYPHRNLAMAATKPKQNN
jgi:hypothetical protein